MRPRRNTSISRKPRLCSRSCSVLLAAAACAFGAEPPDTALYESVLRQHVNAGGAVDYAGIRRDPAALRQFLAQAAEVGPETAPALYPTSADRLAYWANIYNAIVLDSFARTYPEQRTRLQDPTGRYLFFQRMTRAVDGRDRSLEDIRKNSIRAEHEPRIHFALSAACKSCPVLPRVALTAANLDEQLDAAARRYLNDAAAMRVALTGAIQLPAMLDWYADDFGGTAGVLRFVAKYRPELAHHLTRGKWRPEYLPWNWSPNDGR